MAPVYYPPSVGGGGSGSAIGATEVVKIKSGHWFGPFIAPGAGSWGGALNRLDLVPMWISQNTPVDLIAALKADAGAGGGLVRLGIFNAKADGMPGTVRLDAGTAAADTSGIKQIAITETLTPGLYYLGACPQIAFAGTFRCYGFVGAPSSRYGWDWDNGYFVGEAANAMTHLSVAGVTGAFADLSAASFTYNTGGIKVGLRAS